MVIRKKIRASFHHCIQASRNRKVRNSCRSKIYASQIQATLWRKSHSPMWKDTRISQTSTMTCWRTMSNTVMKITILMTHSMLKWSNTWTLESMAAKEDQKITILHWKAAWNKQKLSRRLSASLTMKRRISTLLSTWIRMSLRDFYRSIRLN